MGLGSFLKNNFVKSDFYKTYFSIGNSNIRKKANNSFRNYDENDGFSSLSNYNKYKDTIDKHYQLNDKIQVMYSIAINQENIFNEHTKKCEQLCLEDIKLAPTFRKYLGNDYNSEEAYYGMYSAFPTLAKLYEKKGDIDNAILICTQAIQLGFIIDHSKGGMQGRLARLIKKHNQNSERKLQYDYEKNILFDDETGEPLF